MCVFRVRIRILRTFVYVFCVRCADFYYVYGCLCVLNGFFLRIRIFMRIERLLIRWNSQWSDIEVSLICWKSWWSDLEDSLICSKSWWSVTLFFPSVRYDWAIWRIQSLWFRWFIFPRELFVIIGPCRGSDLYGSVEFFIRQSACDSLSGLTSEASCWYWYRNIFIPVE